MDLTSWYARVHRNIQINLERDGKLHQYRQMIAEIPVKEQKCFNVHLSELPTYHGRV